MFKVLSGGVARTAFPRCDRIAAEAEKVAWARMATGALIAWRSGLIGRDAFYYLDASGRYWVWVAMAEMLLGLALMLGVAPRSCALALLASQAWFSIQTGTYNLAPMLLVPLLVALLLLETGRRALWATLRPPFPAEQYRCVYAVLFLAFAAMNFRSAVYHLHEPAWLTGRALGLAFTGSYFGRLYQFWRWCEEASPRLFWLFSNAIIAGQLVFQLGMVPLVAFRWGRRWVQAWGWLFILGCALDLELALLPAVEALIWLLLFDPAPFAAARKIPANGPRGVRAVAGSFCFGYGLLIALFMIDGVADAFGRRGLPFWIKNSVFYYTGLCPPNVFTGTDLKLSDRWVTIERRDLSGRYTAIPYVGLNGERLSYHLGELILYTNSLPLRQGLVTATNIAAYFAPKAAGWEFTSRLCRYDYRRSGLRGSISYRVTLWGCAVSQFSFAAAARYRVLRLHEFALAVNGADVPIDRE